MSNASILTSHRAGNWSRPSNIPDSPWFGSGYDDVAITPSSTATDEDIGFVACIDHAVVVDVDSVVGASYPSAGWAPPTFSASAGSAVTRLASGNYRACYVTRSNNGLSSVGNSETTPILITHLASKPRITFPSAPPAGHTYYLYLTTNDGASGSERVYCWSVAADHVDLVTEKHNNTYSALTAPIVESDVNSVLYGRGVVAPPRLRTCNGITIGPTGSLRVAAGVSLVVRGDIWIESTTGSASDYIILEWGASLRFDSSLAVAPNSTEYQLWFAGGGRIRFMGPT